MKQKDRRERLKEMHAAERARKDEANALRRQQEAARAVRTAVVRAAAKWWADQLRSSAGFDNGDNPHCEEGVKVVTLVEMGRNKHQQHNTPEVIDQFEVALSSYLYWFVTIFGRIGVFMDYDPCTIIADAAMISGAKTDITSLSSFSQMWVSRESVMAKAGYGAQFTELELVKDEPSSAQAVA